MTLMQVSKAAEALEAVRHAPGRKSRSGQLSLSEDCRKWTLAAAKLCDALALTPAADLAARERSRGRVVYGRDFAGHSDLTTTSAYVHKIESAERTAAAVLALGTAM